MQPENTSHEPSRGTETWRFENPRAGDPPTSGEHRRASSNIHRLVPELTTVLSFIAIQELQFALIYDVVKAGRAPSATLAVTIGALTLGTYQWGEIIRRARQCSQWVKRYSSFRDP